MIPSIGRIVHYRLTEYDVAIILDQREMKMQFDRTGASIFHGNPLYAGDVFPMMITKIWGLTTDEESVVEGQVFLDGNDTLWVTSVAQLTDTVIGGESLNGVWFEPPRVPPRRNGGEVSEQLTAEELSDIALQLTEIKKRLRVR